MLFMDIAGEQVDFIDEAIAVARELLEIDPVDESTHQRVMQLELHRGNLKGALYQYRFCSFALETYLGIEPLDETKALADVVLRLQGSCFEMFWGDACDG